MEVPHRNRNSGLVYTARIDLALPGKDIVIRREAHEDLHRALNLAFDAALRRLQAHARRKRGEVKHHEEAPRGRVASLFPEAGYGFIVSPDGRNVYFHRNSVRNERFEDMQVGMEVVFTEEQGERRAEIYDFKSNRRRDDESEEAFAQRMRGAYDAQMANYRRALAHLSGLSERAISCTLLLTATRQAVTV